MKDSKTIKVKTIAGTVATLAAATVMTMAPISQAQAVGLVTVHDPTCASSRGNSTACNLVLRAEGGASGSVSKAKADARRRAVCPGGRFYVPGTAKWGLQGRWKNWDWYYADIQFSCGMGNLKSTGMKNGKPTGEVVGSKAVNDLR